MGYIPNYASVEIAGEIWVLLSVAGACASISGTMPVEWENEPVSTPACCITVSQ